MLLFEFEVFEFVLFEFMSVYWWVRKVWSSEQQDRVSPTQSMLVAARENLWSCCSLVKVLEESKVTLQREHVWSSLQVATILESLGLN